MPKVAPVTLVPIPEIKLAPADSDALFPNSDIIKAVGMSQTCHEPTSQQGRADLYPRAVALNLSRQVLLSAQRHEFATADSRKVGSKAQNAARRRFCFRTVPPI